MSSLAIKVIAVICMTVDHLAVVINNSLFADINMSFLASNMRVIGRAAFPLF